MKSFISILSVLLFSTTGLAQSQSILDSPKEIVKNVGTVLKECPVSYGAKVLIAVGETIPALSAFIKIGNDVNETSKQIAALQQNQNVADNSFIGHGRKFSSYFFGGVVATVYETVKQVGTGTFNSDVIQKAFADGYFVTRSETAGTRACAEAASTIEQLVQRRAQN